jgi:FdhE protein
MAQTGAPPKGDPRLGDMTQIGEAATPAFARLPDPLSLFVTRAARFRTLAAGHTLAPYLLFLADLCDAQHRAQQDLPDAILPDAETRRRARDFAMPPLDRHGFAADTIFEATLRRFLEEAAAIAMPETAAAALARLRDAGAAPEDGQAEAAFVAAALQLHFARLAAGLDAKALVPVGDGACPACGGAPAASMVVGWQDAHGTRYCGCALCGSLWNYVRVKCALCGSTEGIAYQEIEGGAGTVKAETCGKCHGYLKIFQQHKDPAVELIADDVASLALDLLVRETGFRRGGANPVLWGY